MKEFQVQPFTEIYIYPLVYYYTYSSQLHVYMYTRLEYQRSRKITYLKNTKTVGKILEPNPNGPFNIVRYVTHVMVIITGIRNPASILLLISHTLFAWSEVYINIHL